MRRSKNPKPACAVGHELVVSARGNAVDIYGDSLEEASWRYEKAIQKTIARDLRAIEQGRYAIFLLSQLRNFPRNRQEIVSRKIYRLLDDAIATLLSLENREKSKYRHIIRNFKQHRDGLSIL